ncbi:hypothetical protein DERP_006830 [Dermatophagoides pteronyssinus]|uniref:Uncharacterized protein n=1 Tax=Dermatophagoides pteronyssinus TaxID=6956 RepID=A0ABQ8IS51_DERPT|nr:hypothetical protein DERP_006830 [Dermatophagoides pteronyssinus]
MIFPKPRMWRQWPFRYRSPRRRSRSRPAISKRRIAVQGQDSLDGDVDGWAVECLEHDLGHLFSVGFWIQWSFSQQDWAFFWGNTQFIVEGMMPDLFHIIPVGYDTVFNWIFQASSPAKPALHIPEPLSTTNAVTSSSHILFQEILLELFSLKQQIQ